MIIAVIVLGLCVLLESLVIVELLKQRRQIALQLKLLRQAWEWGMGSEEKTIRMEERNCDMAKK